MEKIKWNDFLIYIASKEYDQNRFPIHLDIFYEMAILYKNDNRLNFKIIDDAINTESNSKNIYSKYKRAVRTSIRNLKKDLLGEGWVFEKANEKQDGKYIFNLIYYNPDYENFFNNKYINVNSIKKNDDYKFEYNSFQTNQRHSGKQKKFSNDIKKIWKNKEGKNYCSFCNIQIGDLIEAAHLYENKEIYSDINEENRFFDPMNGIPLCKNCHKLFDSNKINIDQNTLKIYIDNELNDIHIEEYKNKLNKKIVPPENISENIKYFLNKRNINKNNENN